MLAIQQISKILKKSRFYIENIKKKIKTIILKKLRLFKQLNKFWHIIIICVCPSLLTSIPKSLIPLQNYSIVSYKSKIQTNKVSKMANRKIAMIANSNDSDLFLMTKIVTSRVISYLSGDMFIGSNLFKKLSGKYNMRVYLLFPSLLEGYSVYKQMELVHRYPSLMTVVNCLDIYASRKLHTNSLALRQPYTQYGAKLAYNAYILHHHIKQVSKLPKAMQNEYLYLEGIGVSHQPLSAETKSFLRNLVTIRWIIASVVAFEKQSLVFLKN